ncbi:MAG: OmpA family protein [Acidobacteria bacterium]|nr:OmpA family protein [Acidobacteriota bacterium]
MMRALKSKPIALVLGAGALVFLSGCATKTYVGEQVDASKRATDVKIGEVQTQVESTQNDVKGLKDSDARQNQQITQLSDTAREALARAQEAGKLAKGKLLYEVTLSDDSVHFPLNSAVLSTEAQEAIGQLAGRLVSENQNVYIEVQGHTDATGSEEYNLRLGEKRAEAVRRVLNIEKGIPLHRISVISYGQSKPVADNATRDGRAKNRRVTLVVLI